MKVYFSGAHSTGKSTLARFVSQKYQLSMISETARMVLSEQELQIDTLRCDLDIVDHYQQQVFDRQLVEEAKHSSFVSDRSLIDILAYSATHSRILPSLLKRRELDTYLTNLRDTQSILFLVRPSAATLRADGVREALNWDGIISIDAQIRFMFEMWEIPYFQIQTNSMQERVSTIRSVIRLHQAKA